MAVSLQPSRPTFSNLSVHSHLTSSSVGGHQISLYLSLIQGQPDAGFEPSHADCRALPPPPLQEASGHLCFYGLSNELTSTKSCSRWGKDTRRSRILPILHNVTIYLEREGIMSHNSYSCVEKYLKEHEGASLEACDAIS